MQVTKSLTRHDDVREHQVEMVGLGPQQRQCIEAVDAGGDCAQAEKVRQEFPFAEDCLRLVRHTSSEEPAVEISRQLAFAQTG